ncbi:hypothetical protein BG015_000649 [Linnemannia schmuckeri]|uniref:Uncharacterized protein n=1 Tax=Linnemannia schmuckeri TaxID=64567 RepID=A0A9P5V6Z0_9FUNG|nr:hypothetical protein BG015_000649 [Linnemannia schmuckeri]
MKANEGDPDHLVTMDRLLQMLLSHYYTAAAVDVDDIPKVVRLPFNLAAYRNATITAITSSLDYAAHVRHISLEDWAFTNISFSISMLPPDVQEYIDEPEFMAFYPVDQFLPEYERYNSQQAFRQRCLRVMLHREVTWMLANPILEQLQTLAIPVSDVTRYLSVLDRLGRLECVRFVLDEIYDCHPEEATGATEEWSSKTREHKNKSMGFLVRFVENHTQLFKGQLRVATCHPSSVWLWSRQACPADVQFKFLQLLPSLHKPTALNIRNAVQFVAHPLTTDLGHVEEIVMMPSPGPLLDRLCHIRQFLPCCQSAKRMHLVSLGKGTFKWAVEEKRIVMDGMGGNTLSNGGRGSASLLDNDRPAFLQHDLVALDDVWINNIRDGSTDEVDDIAIAFSQTLADFRVTFTMSAQAIPPTFHFGRGWVDMPVLNRLLLETVTARMVLDRELLVHCPNVTFVLLGDRTFDYRCQDIVPCLPAQPSRLVTLRLYGWSALTFHSDTLYSTSELRTLEVRMTPRFSDVDVQDQYFIPPVEELNRSEDIGGDDDEDDDNSSSRQQSPPPPSTKALSAATERIILPALTDLQLLGNWIIEDDFLFEFLAVTFPKLVYLDLLGPTCFTLWALFSVARAVPVPWKSLHVFMREPPRDQWAELGLWSLTEWTDERKVLPMYLRFSVDREYEYVVLRDPGVSVAAASANE